MNTVCRDSAKSEKLRVNTAVTGCWTVATQRLLNTVMGLLVVIFIPLAGDAIAQSTAPSADQVSPHEQTDTQLQFFYGLIAKLRIEEGNSRTLTGHILLASDNPEICSTFFRYTDGRAAKRLNRQLSLKKSGACRIAYQGYEGSAFARLCLGSEAGSLAGAQSRFADFKRECHCFNPCGPNG